MGFTDFNIV